MQTGWHRRGSCECVQGMKEYAGEMYLDSRGSTGERYPQLTQRAGGQAEEQVLVKFLV